MGETRPMTVAHCISQCEDQAREQLDPDLSRFMASAAGHLRRLEVFARACLHPDEYGWAVSDEVRAAARAALGIR